VSTWCATVNGNVLIAATRAVLETAADLLRNDKQPKRAAVVRQHEASANVRELALDQNPARSDRGPARFGALATQPLAVVDGLREVLIEPRAKLAGAHAVCRQHPADGSQLAADERARSMVEPGRRQPLQGNS
jgi:hypothetical protein